MARLLAVALGVLMLVGAAALPPVCICVDTRVMPS